MSVVKKSMRQIWRFLYEGKSPDGEPEALASEYGYAIMFLLAIVVGTVAGFGAILFRYLITVIHNLLFLGEFSFHYSVLLHTPKHLPAWGILFVPVLGGLLVSVLVQYFATESRGHGVPEVMNAMYYNQGRIRPIVGVIKAIASSITIGSGGSAGREGPIVQIGASFGSFLGQVIKMTARQRLILLAAGASAGIAATFNAPIGGVAFAVEVMLVSAQARTLLPVVVAVVVASYISYCFTGGGSLFHASQFAMPIQNSLFGMVLLCAVPLGMLVGLLSLCFTKGLYWFEDQFTSLTNQNKKWHKQINRITKKSQLIPSSIKTRDFQTSK